ncbi:hypothetical protein ERW49_18830 [Aliivibrio finisterrensis]|uniref:Uncharacterized protein n=1 Tax=Aliivibrio finisterrensis TaxID=511998 RepID=A0A4Q5K5V1_9GAMM|nr:hypothetical protein [Aliivibrio finisterrensis]RYU41124.1 hypothetical protein ERW49_18830 [Aliivibrio finisterrensis]
MPRNLNSVFLNHINAKDFLLDKFANSSLTLSKIERLSAKELHVFAILAKGLTISEIGRNSFSDIHDVGVISCVNNLIRNHHLPILSNWHEVENTTGESVETKRYFLTQENIEALQDSKLAQDAFKHVKSQVNARRTTKETKDALRLIRKRGIVGAMMRIATLYQPLTSLDSRKFESGLISLLAQNEIALSQGASND